MIYEDLPDKIKSGISKEVFEDMIGRAIKTPRICDVWAWPEDGASVEEVLTRVSRIADLAGLKVRPTMVPKHGIYTALFQCYYDDIESIVLLHENKVGGIAVVETAAELKPGDVVVVYDGRDEKGEVIGPAGFDIWYKGHYCGGWRRNH